MNVRINEADAVILRKHMREAHRSLFDSVVDGPLDIFEFDSLPIDVIAAIHDANHLAPWRDHQIDNWKA